MEVNMTDNTEDINSWPKVRFCRMCGNELSDLAVEAGIDICTECGGVEE